MTAGYLCRRITDADTVKTNTRSQHVLEKTGFTGAPYDKRRVHSENACG